MVRGQRDRVLVSHDFRLLKQTAEEIWEVKDKKIINLTKRVRRDFRLEMTHSKVADGGWLPVAGH